MITITDAASKELQRLLAQQDNPHTALRVFVTPGGCSGMSYGMSFDDEEHALGTRCVAASVFDEHSEPLGAISLAGPSTRLPDERIRQLGPVVAHAAEELTKRLGGHWPHPR